MTSQLAAALRAAAAGIHPDEAAAGLIISHGTFLHREDFLCHVETAACISDGTPMAWIDWDAVIAALDGGRLPASGGEKRIVRLAASLAAGHLVASATLSRALTGRAWNWSPPRSATPPDGTSECPVSLSVRHGRRHGMRCLKCARRRDGRLVSHI